VRADGRPAEVLVQLHKPLEDPSLHWVRWDVPFVPPKVGQRVVLPEADRLSPMFDDADRSWLVAEAAQQAVRFGQPVLDKLCEKHLDLHRRLLLTQPHRSASGDNRLGVLPDQRGEKTIGMFGLDAEGLQKALGKITQICTIASATASPRNSSGTTSARSPKRVSARGDGAYRCHLGGGQLA